MKKNTGNESSKVDIDAIKHAIRGLESPKMKRERERAAQFAELYPDISDKLNAEVSKSAIVKALTEYGMSISGSVFDKLLADEARRRLEPVPGDGVDESGDDVATAEAANAPQGEENGEEID